MRKSSLNYPVEFVTDIFGESTVLAEHLAGHRVLLVADLNLAQRVADLGRRIGRYVTDHSITLAGKPILIGGGEKLKMEDSSSVRTILSALATADFSPNDLVLALGGGSLLDVAGFAAAQFQGGVPVVRVPTTPGALMDAAFSTRACVNFADRKDLLSVSSVPKAVFLDLPFARTVLDGVWRGGFSEAVRLAVAYDTTLLKKLSDWAADYATRSESVLEAVVHAVVAVRQKKGETDLGLVSAADLQKKSNWKLPHGYAVAIGILQELQVAVHAGTAQEAVFMLAKEALQKSGALEGLAHSRHILPPELTNF